MSRAFDRRRRPHAGRHAADDRASFVGMLAELLFVGADLFVFSTPGIGSVIAAGLVILLWYIGRRLRFRGEYRTCSRSARASPASCTTSSPNR